MRQESEAWLLMKKEHISDRAFIPFELQGFSGFVFLKSWCWYFCSAVICHYHPYGKYSQRGTDQRPASQVCAFWLLSGADNQKEPSKQDKCHMQCRSLHFMTQWSNFIDHLCLYKDAGLYHRCAYSPSSHSLQGYASLLWVHGACHHSLLPLDILTRFHGEYTKEIQGPLQGCFPHIFLKTYGRKHF